MGNPRTIFQRSSVLISACHCSNTPELIGLQRETRLITWEIPVPGSWLCCFRVYDKAVWYGWSTWCTKAFRVHLQWPTDLPGYHSTTSSTDPTTSQQCHSVRSKWQKSWYSSSLEGQGPKRIISVHSTSGVYGRQQTRSARESVSTPIFFLT